MSTITRKEREREARILQLAQEMLGESGYLGLSMDRIAAEMEYSKGTIYQHFPNKEEIILALANQALETRVGMFEKASTWNGTTRERMTAVGVAAAHFVRLYPHHFEVEQLVRSGSIWEKATPNRRSFLLHCEASCMRVLGGVVRDAVAAGDLTLREGVTPVDVVFGLWSTNFGAHIIITSTDTLGLQGITDPERTLWLNLNMLLDGYQWRDLSTDVDHNDDRRGIPTAHPEWRWILASARDRDSWWRDGRDSAGPCLHPLGLRAGHVSRLRDEGDSSVRNPASPEAHSRVYSHYLSSSDRRSTERPMRDGANRAT